jgi:hypothetical protein
VEAPTLAASFHTSTATGIPLCECRLGSGRAVGDFLSKPKHSPSFACLRSICASTVILRPLKGTCKAWRPAACPVKYRRGGLVHHITAQNDLHHICILQLHTFRLNRNTGYPDWSFLPFLSPSQQISHHNSIGL